MPYLIAKTSLFAFVICANLNLNYEQVFECTKLVLQPAHRFKSASRDLKGRYLESLEVGVYKVLARDNSASSHFLQLKYAFLDKI